MWKVNSSMFSNICKRTPMIDQFFICQIINNIWSLPKSHWKNKIKTKQNGIIIIIIILTAIIIVIIIWKTELKYWNETEFRK